MGEQRQALCLWRLELELISPLYKQNQQTFSLFHHPSPSLNCRVTNLPGLQRIANSSPSHPGLPAQPVAAIPSTKLLKPDSQTGQMHRRWYIDVKSSHGSWRNASWKLLTGMVDVEKSLLGSLVGPQRTALRAQLDDTFTDCRSNPNPAAFLTS